MTIHRLVYHSRSLLHLTEKGPLDAIRQIMSCSNRNNSALNITGCLLIDRMNIMQILEGKADHIYRLFKIIEADMRHKNFSLVDFQSIAARNFAGWSMAGSVRTHLDDAIYQAHNINGPIAPEAISPASFIALSQDLLRHHHA